MVFVRSLGADELVVGCCSRIAVVVIVVDD